MMRRPSEARPEGCLKKVWPYGDGISATAALQAPVSELESPKLYIAGNLHLCQPLPILAGIISATSVKTKRPDRENNLIDSILALPIAPLQSYYIIK